MFDDRQSFLSRAFLRSEWELDYKQWTGGGEDAALLQRLRDWAARPDLKETSAEGAFVQTFFVDTWGYQLAGRSGERTFTAYPQYTVAGAGAGGSAGVADLALGGFGETASPVPQALCEFKDIRSDLDAPQPRKGNTRSPVEQCLDYLAGARRGLYGAQPIWPWWGLVTDMNEFRLYWWERGRNAFLRFTVKAPGLLPDLLGTDEESRFDRFLFARVFHRDRLLSRDAPPSLLRLVERQGGQEKALEGGFYQDYKGVRDQLFDILRQHNPRYAASPGKLLRLAQKLLDRFIFAFYCEDMGQRMLFPPQLIRDTMKERSLRATFDDADDDLWREFSKLFRVMDGGGRLGQLEIRAINGGLFREDPAIEALSLPNRFFCLPGQGKNEASVKAHPRTLLHLCASYNYAARGDAGESITLYTLGRIFEQSITELEKKEAELEGRESLAVLAKRKLPTRRGQGVYYTPEWVVERIVEGTLDPWFAEARRAAGWTGEAPETPDQLQAYRAKVEAIRVVDPACGSGAFLIGAFRRLLREREMIEDFRRLLDPLARRASDADLTAAILDRNLFGVDISGAAVEIAKLALWLHSARADAPLSSLDGAVKSGNSLVAKRDWRGPPLEGMEEPERERINAFDWETEFPFGGVDPGRFDVVLGNPPYVKLQNLRQVSPATADYLAASGAYNSTTTGNFDLYLPFIEKGLRLLRPGGRMGYIAPSLWAVNEYGAALRRQVREARALERWVDFRSHQIFDEAITYTALQFFTAAANEAVEVVPAPRGEPDLAAAAAEDGRARALPYARLPHDEPWLLATGEERALIDRLAESCPRLDDPSLTTGIIVGIQTSADSIYHLQRLGTDRYRCAPDGRPAYEVEIEDAMMKPLVSGAEAKRYEEPRTDTFLLFPYERDTGRMGLIPAEAMKRRFPKAWAHLKSCEADLRGRENGAFDDADWYRFGRNQNIDKQDRIKLIVPRLVMHLKSSLDSSGRYYLDNVDVGGVLATRPAVAAFLNGVLNGPVADFVFRRLSKPFQNDYRSANKQFIAPLPVPDVDGSEQAAVARKARALQKGWTRRRDLLAACAARLGVLARARHSEAWLWPDLPDWETLDAQAAKAFKTSRERRDWAQARFDEALDDRHAALQTHLDRGGPWEARFADGELRLLARGAVAVGGVFLEEAQGRLAEAYWRWLLLNGLPREAKRLAAELRRPPTEPDKPAAAQFMGRVDELAAVTRDIGRDETAMDALLFDLYALTPEERRLVQRDAPARIGH